MTNKIASVANLALHVFRVHSQRFINQSTASSSYCPDTSILQPDALKQLLANVNALTLEDVGLGSFDFSPYPAPVIYIHITENEIFSMGLFVLRPGSRIPLHGHPDMFGVLRVMNGTMRCRSFTHLPRAPDVGPLSKLCGKGAAKWQLCDFTVATPDHDTLIRTSHPSCLLTPLKSNLHEINSVGEDLVIFLDILAPPYNHDLGTRECLFYREVDIPTPKTLTEGSDAKGEDSTPFVYLIETNQPSDYWCDHAPYLGPSVK